MIQEVVIVAKLARAWTLREESSRYLPRSGDFGHGCGPISGVHAGVSLEFGQTRLVAIMNRDITRVLEAIERGESLASEQLLPLVYDELRRLAARKMAEEARDHTLQPTALVHEAYLRLVGDRTLRDGTDPNGSQPPDSAPKWQSRGHFYAAAAEAMRRILIEAARRKASLKRGHGRLRVEFSDDIAEHESASADSLLALDEALQKLEAEDPESFQIVMLRYFGGLTVAETAAALGVSPRTAKRHWSFARAWLQREIDTE